MISSWLWRGNFAHLLCDLGGELIPLLAREPHCFASRMLRSEKTSSLVDFCNEEFLFNAIHDENVRRWFFGAAKVHPAILEQFPQWRDERVIVESDPAFVDRAGVGVGAIGDHQFVAARLPIRAEETMRFLCGVEWIPEGGGKCRRHWEGQGRNLASITALQCSHAASRGFQRQVRGAHRKHLAALLIEDKHRLSGE